MIENLSEPTVLFALVIAFYLGFTVRGWGRNSLSPTPMTQEDIKARMAARGMTRH